MKLKEATGQRRGRLICETGAMEGCLKDVSQRAREEEVEEGGREWKHSDGSEAEKK